MKAFLYIKLYIVYMLCDCWIVVKESQARSDSWHVGLVRISIQDGYCDSIENLAYNDALH